MTRPQARQAARELLKLRNGRCSVRAGTAIHDAFCEMRAAGLVEVSFDSTGMVNVRIISEEAAREASSL